MRSFHIFLLATVTAFTVTACEKPATRATNSSSVLTGSRGSQHQPASRAGTEEFNRTSIASAEALDLHEDTSSNALDLITARIDTTITLGAWLKSHPLDKVSEVPPVSGVDDPFCRGAVAQIRVMGRALARYAMFYIPALSKAEKLPTDTAAAPGDYCELRTIVLVSEETDFPRGRALRDSLGALIETRLGQPRKAFPLGAGGVSGTDDGKIWDGPGTKVVVATGIVNTKPDSATHANHGEEGGETVAVDSAKPAVARTFAVAYAPGSGAQDFDTWASRYDGESARRIADQHERYSDVDSTLAWAAVPALSADLGTVVTFIKAHDPENISEVRPRQVDDALVRALKTIHDVAPTLSSPRRAAALVAGEVTLFGAFEIHAADSNRKVNRALDSLGISFGKLEGEDGVVPTHPWLWQAWRIDSTGRAGRAAFVRLLGLWWPDTNACNGDEYARMIKEGEAELKRGDNNPAIYYYVGAAYKSIYDFAHFETEDFGPPQRVKDQAEAARLKGIEYLRSAVRLLPDGEMRRAAWEKGMRLMMRRSGEQPEYVCIPD